MIVVLTWAAATNGTRTKICSSARVMAANSTFTARCFVDRPPDIFPVCILLRLPAKCCGYLNIDLENEKLSILFRGVANICNSDL